MSQYESGLSLMKVGYQTKALDCLSSSQLISTRWNLSGPVLSPKNQIYGPLARYIENIGMCPKWKYEVPNESVRPSEFISTYTNAFKPTVPIPLAKTRFVAIWPAIVDILESVRHGSMRYQLKAFNCPNSSQPISAHWNLSVPCYYRKPDLRM